MKNRCNKINTMEGKQDITEKNTIDLNGFIIEKNYIPEELISEILCHVHHKQLILCHLVCKNWNNLIKKHIWRRKAELCSLQILPNDDNIPWTVYYSICDKKPFNRNLLLSDNILEIYSNEFKTTEIDMNVTHPIVNVVPFPDELICNGKLRCIVLPDIPFKTAERKLVIDLIEEGLTEYLLDKLQPIIKITEWYCCKWEVNRAQYTCSIKLIKKTEDEDSNKILRLFHYQKNLEAPEKRGQWFKFTHTFKNYGEGLRTIKFYHGGDHGVIIAGSSVEVISPCTLNTKKKDK